MENFTKRKDNLGDCQGHKQVCYGGDAIKYSLDRNEKAVDIQHTCYENSVPSIFTTTTSTGSMSMATTTSTTTMDILMGCCQFPSRRRGVNLVVKDEYGNKLEGFYLVGLFDSGRKALFSLETSKPFKTNENGRSSGNCFRGFERNSFATNWMFIENHKIKDIETDKDLRINLNELWKEWCKEHKRKYNPIMEVKEVKDEVRKGNSGDI